MTAPKTTYTPSAFREMNLERLHEIMATHSFATLIVTQDNVPYISHVPLLLDAKTNCLRGHLARVNPIAKLDLTQPHHAVAIFHGPNAYVSPSWYASKQTTHKVVPTWNYISVHAIGTLTTTSDSYWIQANVAALSDVHEAALGKSWKITDAPANYIALLARAIVGIELHIDSIEGKFKLGQDKKGGDVTGVIEGLREAATSGATPNVSGSTEIADWMARIQNDL
ncbi:FMN-binding domain-containing protein [Achlya hypogyna]|uniref:FMN-binding domain-containing protein n=1 Tax=Achlya hypogyna TaxID=1202772 RepID=A0A1V9YAS8_ACHHY|nr:FMN-binding domain-containing protein [Achlya hypogyna]